MKIHFVLLLIFCSFNSSASWQLIEKNSEYEMYIENNTIKKNGSIFSVTWIYNYYQQNRSGTRKTGYYNYQSYSFDEEINCATKESRLFSSSPYSNAMANGIISTKNFNPKWEPITGLGGSKYVFSYLCR